MHVQDIVSNLQQKERTVYKRSIRQIPENAGTCDGIPKSDIVLGWRRTILQWMYGLTTACDIIAKETVAVTAHYLDVSIDRGMIKCLRDCSLISFTCLYLAIKLFDTAPVALHDLVCLSAGQFGARDVAEMEFACDHSDELAALSYDIGLFSAPVSSPDTRGSQPCDREESRRSLQLATMKLPTAEILRRRASCLPRSRTRLL
jgi:Cyclin, N-terminal domain